MRQVATSDMWVANKCHSPQAEASNKPSQTSEIGAAIAIDSSVRHNNRYISVSDKWPARGPMHAMPKASHPPSLGVPMLRSCPADCGPPAIPLPTYV